MGEKYDWVEAQMAVFDKLRESKEAIKELEMRQGQTIDKIERRMLEKYDRLEARVNELSKEFEEKFTQIHTDIVTLKLKSGIWGAIAGMIPVFVYIVWQLISGNKQ